jgi:multidrug efflux pump subunit AcrA (membrane-fusion protein)
MDRRIYRRLLFWFLGVLLALTFLSRTLQTITLPRVRTETPSRGSLLKVVDAEGTVEPRATVGVYTDLRRKVTSVAVTAGLRVRAGRILAVLDLGELEGAYRNELPRYARGEVDLAGLYRAVAATANRMQEMDLEVRTRAGERVHARLERTQALRAAGHETAEAVRQAEDALEAARLDVERARAGLEAAQAQAVDLLEGCILAAPAGGVVREVNLEVGAYSDTTQPGFVIVQDTLGFVAVVSVPREEADLVALGTEVEVRLGSLEGRALRGAVAEIRETKGSGGEHRDLLIRLPSDPAIHGGERATIYLAVRTAPFPVLVNTAALSRDAQGSFLWVLKERHGPLGAETYVVRSRVRVLDTDDTRSALPGGLDALERYVVWSSKPLVEDGGRVLEE